MTTQPARPANAAYRIGDWILDVGSQRLRRDDRETVLEPKEMAVLLELAEAAPDLVSTDELLERVWPHSVVVSNALHQVVRRLRGAFEEDARSPRVIETISRRGYRLVVSVERLEPGPDPVGSSDRPARTRRHGVWVAAVAVLALLVAVGVVLVYRGLGRTVDEPSPAIAVLPLRNLSPDPDEAYFADAVTQEIWSRLTSVEGLRVISWTSSEAHAGGRMDVREIGQRLMADYLVEGSAARDNGIIRINVHLIDGRSGTQRWGATYREPLSSVGGLYATLDRIAQDLGSALPGRIAGLTQLEASTDPGTEQIAAYNLLQRARFEFNRSGDPVKSLQLAEQAGDIDPNYWMAADWIAAFRHLIAEVGWGEPLANLELSREFALRAVALSGGREGDPFVTLAMLADRLDLDFAAALALYEKAERLGTEPYSLAVSKQDLLLVSGRYEEGLALLRPIVARNPADGWPLFLMARFLFHLDRRDEAIECFERAVALSPENTFVLGNAIGYAILGFGDIERAASLYDGLGAGMKETLTRQHALIEHFQGNPLPLSQNVQHRIRTRGQSYTRASNIMHDLYRLGDIEGHIEWFRVRVKEHDVLGWVVYEQREWPMYADYWERLESWAASDPGDKQRRIDLVEAHRALMDRVTRKMVL